MSATVKIARCPDHGLHGCRATCFVCGGPVEQVEMVPVRGPELERRIQEALFGDPVMARKVMAVIADYVAEMPESAAASGGGEQSGG